MKKSKIYIIGIPIILICIILIILLVKQNQNNPLKVNEVNIDGKVVQLTANKADYLDYENLEGFEVYENKSSFEIEIQNQDILTYKDIKVGDNVNKLDFCDEPVGMVYYFETNHRHKGYHLQIVYGVDPFDDTIISITYEYYNK